MRLLYVAIKHDYGLPSRGYSFEHYNFYQTLVSMGYDVTYFDIGTLHEKYGFEGMNCRLADIVRSEKPTLLFSVLFRYLDPKVVRSISNAGLTPTLNWFSDDQYRFEEFARPWTPSFNWVVTTSQAALPQYAKAGYTNVIKSQWACNSFKYHQLNLPLQYDVTFVGQLYAERQKFIQYLREAGLNVSAWGLGWENGRVTQADMIRIFNQSRINLNFAGGGIPLAKVKARTLQGKVQRWLSVNSDRMPFTKQLKAVFKRKISMPESATPSVLNEATVLQIKGRTFEIPGCGGFMLSGRAENIEDYYREGIEAAYFSDASELAEQAHYYLAREEEREQIAQAGYARTLHEHTYVHRFAEIFQKINLPSPPVEKILAGEVNVGQTEIVS